MSKTLIPYQVGWLAIAGFTGKIDLVHPTRIRTGSESSNNGFYHLYLDLEEVIFIVKPTGQHRNFKILVPLPTISY